MKSVAIYNKIGVSFVSMVKIEYKRTPYNPYNPCLKKELPMKHFTPETFKPREQTLNVIRQFAYTYRVRNNNQALSPN